MQTLGYMTSDMVTS